MIERISRELNAAINEQIGHEFQASHQYIAIASYFDDLALKKLAALFFKQSEEERSHAMKFVHYVNEAGGKVAIPAIPAPKTEFKSVAEAVKFSLEWEKEVTRKIYDLMRLAIEEKDYIGQDFLRWFVSEQLEEESSMDKLLKVAEQAGERNLYMMEAYLSHGD